MRDNNTLSDHEAEHVQMMNNGHQRGLNKSYDTVSGLIADQQAGKLVDGVSIVGNQILPYSVSDPNHLSPLLDAIGSLYNFKAENYPNTCKAIAEVKSGSAIASYNSYKVWYIADSIGVGTGGASPTVTNFGVSNAGGSFHKLGPVPKICAALSAKGVVARNQSIWGYGHVNNLSYLGGGVQLANYNYVDSRITITGSWPMSLDFESLDGKSMETTAISSSASIAFLPADSAGTVNTDVLEVYYVSYNNFNVNVKVGGTDVTGSPFSVGDTGSNFYTKKTVVSKSLGTPAANTWTIGKNAADGTALLLQGFCALDSTKPELSFCNISVGGQQLSYYADSVNHSRRYSLLTDTNNDTVKNDITNAVNSCSVLAIVQFSINETFAGATYAASLALMTNYITALKSAGLEVLVVIPHRTGYDDPKSNIPGTYSATANAVRNAYRSAAINTGCAVVDIDRRWGDWSKVVQSPNGSSVSPSTANKFNMFYTKNSASNFETDGYTHPAQVGYQDYADAIMSFFTACGA